MRIIFLFTTLVIVLSCSTTKKIAIDDKNKYLLFGEWKLNVGDNINDIRLIFLETGEFYKFSRFDGGSLITKGTMYSIDSIVYGEYNMVTSISFVDTNLILSENIPSNHGTWAQYKKLDSDNYKKTLVDYLVQDSVRKKLIGWWKLSESTESEHTQDKSQSKNFTLSIGDNGEAVRYNNHKYDSADRLTYRMMNNGIKFQYGCLVDNHAIVYVDTNTLKLTWNRDEDTLSFKRLMDIK